jgi:hypothetical protein
MMNLRFALSVLAIPLWACGAAMDDPMAADGGVGEADGQIASCATPDLAPDWLASMQSEVVGKLSGDQAISAGVVLADRSTTQNRARAQVYLEQELTALGYEVQRQAFGGAAPGTNVYAEVAGTEEGFYVIGAHFDSVPQSPGANDNATGVAAVLATARMMTEQECLTRGLIFVFFDQEENGLVGSRAFASELASAGRTILGAYTLDQLGWDSDGDRRMEVELPAAGMLDGIRASIASHGLPVEVIETTTAGSDHTAFREQGFPAAGLTEEYVSGDTTPHYHSSSDTFATVDLNYLASCTSVLAALVSDLVSDGG